MIKFIDYFYPVQKLSNDYLEKYETTKITKRAKSNKNNTLLIGVIALIYVLIMIYTIYLLTKCLGQKDGSGNFVNNVSEFVLAVFFLPVYLFYRSFINPCSAPKISNNVAPTPTPVVNNVSSNPVVHNVSSNPVLNNVASTPNPVVQTQVLSQSQNPKV